MQVLNRTPLPLRAAAALIIAGAVVWGAEDSARAQAVRDAGISQSFQWGEIDSYTPLPLGNGDIGGTFDPFGGTEYDELRYGSGARRDIRTLFLTQLMMPDYWVLEDQQARYLNPRYYRPKFARKYLSYGAPFNIVLRPERAGFPEKISAHQQTLRLEEGILETQYNVGPDRFEVETFISASGSLLVYRVRAAAPMRFEVRGIASPRLPESEDGASANPRHRAMKDGYSVDESAGDLLVLKQVSNVFCPAYVAVAAPGSRRVEGGFRIPPGEHSVFLAIGHSSLDKPKVQAVHAARDAAREGYAGLRARQASWWRDFWQRSYVLLPDKRLERMWYRSVYYLACSLPRRIRAFSPEGIYGVFPAFAGFHPQDSVYHLFAALSSNHAELGKAQAEYVLETLPVAQAAARHIYYLDGARYPWHSTPGLLPYLPGHANDGYYLHEHAVNGWIVEFIRRYLGAYGNDPKLTARFYPVLREVARFFSSMLTPRGDGLEIVYVPAAGQEESVVDINQKNIFDIVVSAKWSLRTAAAAAERLGVDAADAARWREEDSKLSLDYSLRPDMTYGSFENDAGHTQKAPSQLIGTVMTSLFEGNETKFLNTFRYLEKAVTLAACAWSPGYFAIAAARLKRPEEALKSLQASFDFSKAPWILFVENTHHVPGRMPYYLAGHALFVQGLNEMLLQDWTGKPELFPANPFRTAAFKLRAGDRVIEASIHEGTVRVLSDSPAETAR